MVTENIPNWLVVVLGLAIVFIGLICIIVLCIIMSRVVKLFEKKSPAEKSMASAAVSAPTAPIANKQELLAAICAAVADDLGTDVSGIQILSFKRI